ncbi:hypothetical protein THAOC_34713 [Thalassiosira oceanica]|uniref:Uncharacterized protein n=1 Tax=Thalassiosira oceanica TaxID=159749 RepID=K0RC02_THAOC|nr:hypothetical protein THAOC_34713 [Thalassiosira oceanica]|eukprot:EJK46616.1 hypothetical protein THAOC_34713 [Thalassiosira oceanica]
MPMPRGQLWKVDSNQTVASDSGYICGPSGRDCDWLHRPCGFSLVLEVRAARKAQCRAERSEQTRGLGNGAKEHVLSTNTRRVPGASLSLPRFLVGLNPSSDAVRPGKITGRVDLLLTGGLKPVEEAIHVTAHLSVPAPFLCLHDLVQTKSHTLRGLSMCIGKIPLDCDNLAGLESFASMTSALSPSGSRVLVDLGGKMTRAGSVPSSPCLLVGTIVEGRQQPNCSLRRVGTRPRLA